MTVDARQQIRDSMDVAQAAATAVLHGDKNTAEKLLLSVDALPLVLVLVDLVAYVHHHWATTVGMGIAERNQAWTALLLDIEAWRITKGENG